MSDNANDTRVQDGVPVAAGPCAMVIFGAGGDLTKRMLIPALYHLSESGLLPEAFAVIGVDIKEQSDDDFRKAIAAELGEFIGTQPDPAQREGLLERLHYVHGDFGNHDTYRQLAGRLDELDRAHGTGGNYLFYLATPPRFFAEIASQLGAAGLLRQPRGQWRRVVIEKPFGHDLESARQLNAQLSSVLDESQIFRIDHYLGKETVQNILVFRFSSSIFEPLWNRSHIDHVQITVSEDLGVEHRSSYYETAGALRDMVPNHLFQLLSLIAMEPPASFEADAVRDEKGKILHALQALEPDEVLTRAVRGQYGAGKLPRTDKPVCAYRDEPGIAADSPVETFVALKLSIDNWRWADVPFYLRTGKRLANRSTEIVVQFQRAPKLLFRQAGVERLTPNQLCLRIQPNEGISLRFGAKVSGPVVRVGTVDMNFTYADYFGTPPSSGYETLLYDCMIGDSTLFHRADEVELAWDKVDPILDVWGALRPREFPNYPAGTTGPAAADELLKRDGRAWRDLSPEDPNR